VAGDAWPGQPAASGLRQWPVLERLRTRVERSVALTGMLLVGSLAEGVADALSDLDVLLVATEASFEAAWAGRPGCPTGTRAARRSSGPRCGRPRIRSSGPGTTSRPR
jgi:hypothetical protein